MSRPLRLYIENTPTPFGGQGLADKIKISFRTDIFSVLGVSSLIITIKTVLLNATHMSLPKTCELHKAFGGWFDPILRNKNWFYL